MKDVSKSQIERSEALSALKEEHSDIEEHVYDWDCKERITEVEASSVENRRRRFEVLLSGHCRLEFKLGCQTTRRIRATSVGAMCHRLMSDAHSAGHIRGQDSFTKIPIGL